MASAVVGALRVLLSADTAQFEKALSGADANVQKLANTMKRDLEPSQARINSLVRSFLGSKEIGMAENYAKAVQQIGGAAKLTANDQVRVNKAVNDALAHYRALGREAPKHLIDLANATKQVHPPTEKLSGGMSDLFGKAKLLAGAFGVTLGAGALMNFSRQIIETASGVQDMSKKLGVSTEAVQRWSFAAKQSGADMDNVGRAVIQMNDRLANGDQSTVNALKKVGMSLADVRAMRPEDAFNAIVQALGQIPDPMTRTQVALDLFGKSGAEILPAIEEGFARIGEQAPVTSDKVIKALDEMGDKWEETKARLSVKGANLLAFLSEGTLPEGIPSEIKRRLRELTDTTMPKLPGSRSGALAPDLPFLPDSLKDAEQAITRELEKRAAATKRLADRAAAVEEAYQSWKRALLGLSDAERKELDNQVRLIHEGYLPTVAALLKVESVVKSVTGATTIAGKELQRLFAVVPAQALNVPVGNTAELLAMIEKSNRLRGIKTDAGSLGLWGPTPAQIRDVEKLNAQFGIASDLLGGVASSAQGAFGKVMFGVTGATSAIFKYIVGMKAAKVAQDATAASATALNLTMAGLTFGISAIIGAFASQAAWDAEYNAKLDAIAERAKALGLTLKEVTAISEKWRKEARISVGDRFRGDMSQRDVLDFLEGVQAKIESLAGALDAFGGKVPASLRPMVAELLQMNGLTADMRKQLEGLMGAPAWQKAAERAQALGVDPSSLGSGFNQARIQDTAFSLLHDIQLFEEFNKNVQDFLPGMADELSALAKEAIKTGAALPKTLEPYIRQLDAMGLLLDENGNRIEMGALSFKDIEDEALKAVVDVLKQIRDLLASQLPAAARDFSRSLSGLGSFGGQIGVPKFVPDEQLHMQMPSLGDNWQAYAGASYAGPGSMPSSEGTFNIYAIDAPSFESFLKQRGGAEAVVRSLPDVLERWRGN